MTAARRLLGYLGAVMCLVAFFVAIGGSAFILVMYAAERHSGCGTGVHSLRGLSLPFAALVAGMAVGGCALTSSTGFSSRWWPFLRNIAAGLCFFTFFVVQSNV